MEYTQPVVGQCTDCGVDLHYSDDTFNPWTASTVLETTKHDDGTPHRLAITQSEAAWAEFYRQTGQPPRHDVNHTYRYTEGN